jgi:hypothetical protein
MDKTILIEELKKRIVLFLKSYWVSRAGVYFC